MPPVDIAIPTLPSRSLPSTVRFYGALGFTARILGDSYAILTRGDIEIHFFSHPLLDPSLSHAGCYVRVRDVSAVFNDFQRASLPSSGIPRMDVLENKPWGMKEFAVVDEDGNLLRVGQVL